MLLLAMNIHISDIFIWILHNLFLSRFLSVLCSVPLYVLLDSVHFHFLREDYFSIVFDSIFFSIQFSLTPIHSGNDSTTRTLVGMASWHRSQFLIVDPKVSWFSVIKTALRRNRINLKVRYTEMVYVWQM